MLEKAAEQVHCRIRKEWVAATPEEIVRQQLIQQMIGQLAYPATSLVLERQLKEIPHVGNKKVPIRRADIICLCQGIHPEHALYPLLLVECKAVKLTSKVINQVAGYNHFLGAYFICVANQDEVRTGWYDPSLQNYQFLNRLLSFQELKSMISANSS